jgi:hypothetical protein
MALAYWVPSKLYNVSSARKGGKSYEQDDLSEIPSLPECDLKPAFSSASYWGRVAPLAQVCRDMRARGTL